MTCSDVEVVEKKQSFFSVGYADYAQGKLWLLCYTSKQPDEMIILCHYSNDYSNVPCAYSSCSTIAFLATSRFVNMIDPSS